MNSPADVVNAWAQAWNDRDADALTALFAQDATYLAAIEGVIDEPQRAFKIGCRVWTTVEIDLRRVRIEELGTTALAEVDYSFRGIRRGVVTGYDAEVTFVLVRSEGTWRIRRFHESLVHSPAPPVDVPALGGAPEGLTPRTALAALAEPRRADIVRLLEHEHLTQAEIVLRLGLTQPLLSHHLKVLRQAGLVESATEGRRRVYRLQGRALLLLAERLALMASRSAVGTGS